MEKKEEEGVLIICSKANVAKTEGSESKCKKCSCTVWVSNTTLAAVKQNRPDLKDQEIKDQALCMECGLAEVAKTKDINFVNPTEEQKKEIITSIIRDASKQG